jgi:uncharacterized protein (DUF1501 family)
MSHEYEDFRYGSQAPPSDSDDRPALISRRAVLGGLLATGLAGYGALRRNTGGDPVADLSKLASRTADTGILEVDLSEPAMAAADGLEDMLGQFGLVDEVLMPAPVDQRVLVLIELEGGNDGPSTVVPYGSGTYYDNRPNLAIAGESVLPVDADVGLNPALSDLHQRQLAVVEGVGPVNGSLSHFEMVERWDYGAMAGVDNRGSGFLARLADALDTGAPVTGLSVAGHTPRLNNAASFTLALEGFNQLHVLTKDDWIFPLYRQAMGGIGGGPVASTLADSWTELFAIGRSLPADYDDYDGDSPIIERGGQLGQQLALAAEIIKADLGVRVVHAQLGGFDTHKGHKGRHEQLMATLNGAVHEFLNLIDAAGLSDRVLVATTSEFGRRFRENASGLDHGSASSMLMFGPVTPGRHGEPSPLGGLDDRGNLRTTVPFDRYLATMAQDWLGIEAGSVLPGGPQPLGLIPAARS